MARKNCKKRQFQILSKFYSFLNLISSDFKSFFLIIHQSNRVQISNGNAGEHFANIPRRIDSISFSEVIRTTSESDNDNSSSVVDANESETLTNPRAT